jgi:glycosyltransferase involved in cell wall biosynthesis
MLELSVILCTHNPRRPFLERVLAALRAQTLPVARWELVLVDNASAVPLAGWVDLSWHPQARLVVEEQLGVTRARLRGIAASAGEILVFVDDDNVLRPDYLEQALAIHRELPELGAWGGNVRLEFTAPPPAWTQRHWRLLATRSVPQDVWSRSPEPDRTMPVGAGLCVHRAVARHYAATAPQSALRLQLDRSGRELSSGGDTDLILAAPEIGLSHGLFARLHLDHLIPPERLEEAYLLRLQEGMAASEVLLRLERGLSVLRHETWRWKLKYFRTSLRLWGHRWRFFQARVRGQRRGFETYARLMRG